MLGSNFFEALTPKENMEVKRTALLIGGGVVTLGIAGISIGIGIPLLLIIAAAAGFLTWYLVRNQYVEYEYVIAEKSLEITKIIAQSKRKPMVATTLDKITAFGKLNDAPLISDSTTLVIACAAEDDRTYYADFTHESYGNVRLLMTPDERFLVYFAKHLPRSIGFFYTPTQPIE